MTRLLAKPEVSGCRTRTRQYARQRLTCQNLEPVLVRKTKTSKKSRGNLNLEVLKNILIFFLNFIAGLYFTIFIRQVRPKSPKERLVVAHYDVR